MAWEREWEQTAFRLTDTQTAEDKKTIREFESKKPAAGDCSL